VGLGVHDIGQSVFVDDVLPVTFPHPDQNDHYDEALDD
jgi:hypothetical protein